MTTRKLLTMLAAASGAALIGLTPTSAALQDEFGEVKFSSEASAETMTHISSIPASELESSSSSSESAQVASSESSTYSEEGLAGRSGSSMESSEGLSSSSIEGHWKVETAVSANDE